MTSAKSNSGREDAEFSPLFPEFPRGQAQKIRRYKRIIQPIWTHHKAHFIQSYLRYFVQITKHGVYIDGFAGPQYQDKPESWTAALVLASEPKWLRRFYLCELKRESLRSLKKLVAEQPEPLSRSGRRLPRNIDVVPGDFNKSIDKILGSAEIAQTEATFCLLDQRTFECSWETLVKLASYKKPPNNKIELLYFLGVGWLHRAFSGLKQNETAKRWWGRDDYNSLHKRNCLEIAQIMQARFTADLGYRFAAAYPIFESDGSNRIMYYMIHASDHPDAPALMVRAHAKAVRGLPKETQLSLPGISVPSEG